MIIFSFICIFHEEIKSVYHRDVQNQRLGWLLLVSQYFISWELRIQTFVCCFQHQNIFSNRINFYCIWYCILIKWEHFLHEYLHRVASKGRSLRIHMWMLISRWPTTCHASYGMQIDFWVIMIKWCLSLYQQFTFELEAISE